MDELEPIPADLRTLLEIFDAEIADVAFPDVDNATLQRLAQAVDAGASAVEEAAAALHEARQAFERDRRELLQRAERGLGYAKVFAASDPELRDRLEQLSLGAAPRPRGRPKGTGRPRKPRTDKGEPSAVAELPLGPRAAERVA